MNRLAAAVIAVPLVSGCASFPDYAGADAACISGAMANPLRHGAGGDAHVAIDAIDGVAGWGGGTFCVKPGRHQVTYRTHESVAHAKSQGAGGTIELQMDAGRRYSLRARIVGSTATLQQVDVSEGDAKVVTQFETRTVDSGIRPAVILVPVR